MTLEDTPLQPEPQRQNRKSLSDALYVVIFIVAVVLGSLFINAFIFRSFSVVGPSMEPTLHTGERLIIDKLPATWAHLQGKQFLPNRGQIVVFENPLYQPGDQDQYIVKRVIGLPGERVKVADGVLTVYNSQHPNGFQPDKDWTGPKSPTSGSVDITVPQNEIFVSGDNRVDDYSFDSRNGLGTIPLPDLQGVVSLRLYPFNKLRLF